METDIIYTGDSLEVLKTLPLESVQMCVTSPPYFALRDYCIDGQIGQESSPDEYILRLVDVFEEVRRVLRPDGTLWLNIADTYCGTGSKGSLTDPKYPKGRNGQAEALNQKVQGCKAKDMIGIPWRLALALRDKGWWLRDAIIWEKSNPMPESVKDRCTRCYEYIFLLAKSKNYYFDADSISEPVADSTPERMNRGIGCHKYADGIPGQPQQSINKPREYGEKSNGDIKLTRNKRNIWKFSTASFTGIHYAAFPIKLAETCILAGCPTGGIVLDPFIGSGTVGLTAKRLGRRYIGIDLNHEYCELARKRISEDR